MFVIDLEEVDYLVLNYLDAVMERLKVFGKYQGVLLFSDCSVSKCK